jgi:hypothetical protein
MSNGDWHVSDQELLQAADGELSTRRAHQVQAHLAACWSCRARMASIEATIVDFTQAYREKMDPQLPPIAGPRALLHLQLAELASRSNAPSMRWFLRFPLAIRATAICLSLAAVAVAMVIFLPHTVLPSKVLSEEGAVPDHSLTPGDARSIAIGEVCSMPHEEVMKEVSASLRREVLEEYGIANARPDDYEIDYLIAPGLGGTDDIHNLWPQPYRTQEWNARVKDALEEHLHQMVCAHEIDLSTAQRAIATDWIAAYKRYFHTDRPLSIHAGFDRRSFEGVGVVTDLGVESPNWRSAMKSDVEGQHREQVIEEVGHESTQAL